MKLIYTPADGDRQEFIFRPMELFSFEAEKIEELGGSAWDTLEQFGDLFVRGNRKAWRAALWTMLRRENPKLKFVELVVQVRELNVELEDEEMASARELVENDQELSDDDRKEALEAFDMALLEQSVGDSVILEPGKDEEPADSATDLQ